MTTRRRERNRNRARRARHREERERAIAAATEAMRVAREERRARLGPFVEMYGDGSQLLGMIDRAILAQAREPLMLDVSFGVDAEHEAFADRIIAERLASQPLRPITKRRP